MTISSRLTAGLLVNCPELPAEALPWWAVLLISAGAFLPLCCWQRFHRSGRWAGIALLATALLLGAASSGKLIQRNLEQQLDWDFAVFWLAARTVTEGLDPYTAEHLQEAARDIRVEEEFRQEVMTWGIPYPPPTLLLLLPLGWMELGVAMRVWYSIQGVLCALGVVLLAREFFPQDGPRGLMACAALVLAFFPAALTFAFAQTNFALLAIFLLYWRNRAAFRGGCWLALGMLIKPYFTLLFLFPLLRRHWSVLAGGSVTLLLLFALSTVVLGTPLLESYLFDSPLKKRPEWVYSQPINQSLLATTLRQLKPDLRGLPPYLHPAFLVSASLLVGATSWYVLRARQERGDAELALVACCALLVYPATLVHYAVLLLVPLFLIWKYRATLPGGAATAAVWMSLILTVIRLDGKYVFLMMALLWGTTAVLCHVRRDLDGQGRGRET